MYESSRYSLGFNRGQVHEMNAFDLSLKNKIFLYLSSWMNRLTLIFRFLGSYSTNSLIWESFLLNSYPMDCFILK